jgi:uncharacterized membrane protein
MKAMFYWPSYMLFLQISSLWKLELEMNVSFSFSHLDDLWLVCCLWISRLHVSMTQINVNIRAICDVSKTILKGGGKKVWLIELKRECNFGHEDACINKKGCWFVVKGEFDPSSKGKIILPSYPWIWIFCFITIPQRCMFIFVIACIALCHLLTFIVSFKEISLKNGIFPCVCRITNLH